MPDQDFGAWIDNPGAHGSSEDQSEGSDIAIAQGNRMRSPAGTFASKVLTDQVRSIERDRQGLVPFRRASLTAQATSEARARRRLGGQIAGNTAQLAGSMPRGDFAGALDNALRRTKTRARMATMGDAQVEQQGLKDRMAVATASRRREGELVNAMGRAAQIRQGVNFATADANQVAREAKMGLAGTILGAGAALWKNGGFNNMFGGPPKVEAQTPNTRGIGT